MFQYKPPIKLCGLLGFFFLDKRKKIPSRKKPVLLLLAFMIDLLRACMPLGGDPLSIVTS